MRANVAKLLGATLVILALTWIGVIGLRAQQTAGGPSSNLSTNWVGYLVVGGYQGPGQLGPYDLMPGATGPFPTTVRQVQIGLRSDGVVIWREAPKPK